MAHDYAADAQWFEALASAPLFAQLPAGKRNAWAQQLRELVPSANGRVLLVFDSSVEHVALLLMLLEQQLSPLLVASDATVHEINRYRTRGAIAHAMFLEHGELRVLTLDATSAGLDVRASATTHRGIYLLTSGTTGEPSIVFRDLQSWRDEGLRYCHLLELGPQHRVLFVASICHAYALGWLWGALMAGAQIEIVKPTELAGALAALRRRATHCVVTPLLASLLAQRAGQGGRGEQLEMVMSGAGPVSESIEQQFQQAFGIGLSRNYGSTESGALFGGVAPLPPLSIGFPLPGIRVLDEPLAAQPFALKVMLEDGRVYDTGDIAERIPEGYTIVGRESSAIRRGERWVSAFEIESILAGHEDVMDCSVRAVKSKQAGNDYIFAFVVWRAERAWDEAQLRAHCQAYLAGHKVPDRFERTALIPRGTSGKALLSRRYYPADNAVLLEAAQAYKRSQLLFALWSSGALQLSAQGLNVDQIAQRSGLHATTLAAAFDTALANGLVREGANQPGDSRRLETLAPVLNLETFNSQGWNQLDQLLAVLQRGLDARPFEQTADQWQLRQLYQQAVAGPEKHLAAQLAWRKVLDNVPGAVRLLDISATGAVYTQTLLSKRRLDCHASQVVLLGGLNPVDLDIPVDTHDELGALDARQFDVIVLDNILHQACVAQGLPGLLERLAHNGRLVIDDIFFNDQAASTVGVDWLTHGGHLYPRHGELVGVMAGLGFSASEVSRRESMIFQCTTIFTRSCEK